MADRTVSYDFKANFAQFTAGMAAMGKSVEATATKLTALDANGRKMRSGLSTLGSTAGKIGLVAAAGVAVAIGAAANFEQAMSNVAAATHETSGNMELLRQAALDAGQATQFSATEAASAVENLAKAGVSTADILGGGLTGAMDLAAAGGLEVGAAAEIAATALTQFKLAGEDVPHVADLLAAGAGKAQGEVTDMAMALKQGGLVAAQMGISIEETTGVLAEFASAGLLGSDAGTSLKTMLLRLANPAKESKDLMESLGIAAYDAQGNFVGLESLAGQLATAFEGKTQAERDSALATIFGSDAIRAASVLYQNGASGVADWTAKVDDSGYAAETAATKMDNLKGDLEQLKGSLETALIGAGSGSQGPLRTLTQGLNDIVNAFNKMPPAAQSAVTGLGAVVAVTAGAAWFGAKVIGGIAATRLALQALGVTAATTARAMIGLKVVGGLAVGIGLAAIAIRAINDASRDTLPGVQELTEGLIDLSTAGDIAALGAEFNDLGEDLDKFFDESLQDGLYKWTGGQAVFGDTQAVTEAKDEIEALDSALANLVNTRGPEAATDALFALADSGAITYTQLHELLTMLPQYDDALAGYRLGVDEAATANDGLADSAAGVAAAAHDQAKAIRDAMDAMREQRDAALASFDAMTQYRQAMKDATKQAKDNNAGIRGNSDAALANRDALSGLASGWNDLSNKQKNAAGAFKGARDNFINTAIAMGVPEQAARDLARELLDLPKSKVIPVTTPGVVEATGKAGALKGALDKLKSKSIDITVNYLNYGNKPSVDEQTGAVKPSADGGTVPRSGRPYADRYLYMLADGEEVISNRWGQADRHRALLKKINAGRAADGGTVGSVVHAGNTVAIDPKAAQALALLAKNSQDAAEETKKAAKGLKERLKELEEKLRKASKAADSAHTALDSLKSDKASLSSSVSGALAHDPFAATSPTNVWAAGAGNGLGAFSAQVAADTAAAEAMLAALRTIIQNGVDPTSAFFQQLAASGNVSLVRQFAALTRGELANYALQFATGQGALNAVGEFAGQAGFGEAIKAQVKVVDRLDSSVKHLTQVVHKLEKAVEDMPEKVKHGAKEGTKEGVNGAAAAGYRRGLR